MSDWEKKYNSMASRMRAIKKSLAALEEEAEKEELPFIHRTNPIYRGILALSGIKEPADE